MEAGCQDISDIAGRRPTPVRRELGARQESGGATDAQATVCVFNRTRESFLCLSALAAGALQMSPADAVLSLLAPEDGFWVVPPKGQLAVRTVLPVDLVYLDPENRVVDLIEHLDPARIVPVHPNTSLLKVRIHTIFTSRTQTGDELLICAAEELGSLWQGWQELQAQGTRGEVFIEERRGIHVQAAPGRTIPMAR